MKRALVLSGGGSRGAYQIGAWQALSELGIRYQAVYGTSIGALNACLIAQGDVELAAKIWAEMDIRQILATDDENFSIGNMVHNKRDVLPFLVGNAKNLRMDISPLRKLIAENLDESRVRASGLELGLMTVQVPQMQPVPTRLNDIPSGQLGEWVIASASCFPVFPLAHIGGSRYIDGGYADNMPIDMALEDGADEIIGLDIHPAPVHPEYTHMPFLRLIHPLRSLGGFLDFNKKLLARGRLLGYYDTMKSYGHLDGIRYTFTRRNELDTALPARDYMRRIAAFDAEAIVRVALHSSKETDAPLITAVQREDPLRMYSWKDVWLRGLELCAECMSFRDDAIYDPDILTSRLAEFAASGEEIGGLTERGIQAARAKGGRELISYLVKGLRKTENYPADLVPMLAETPAETAAALYLHCAADRS